jgi:hypothetical protein
MRMMRTLGDLYRDPGAQGSRSPRAFVERLVTSKLEVPPDQASSMNWDRAWRDAENLWERQVQHFHHVLKRDLSEAEERAMAHLDLLARARLAALGWG